MIHIQKKQAISIIVPVLNAEKTIRNCVKSLLNQQYPKKKYEIIIVDNGSKDNTLNILKKFRKKIIILKEMDKGSYCARNKGIKNARGDIIAFTDADCVVDRDWLLHIINVFKDECVKLVGGNIKSLKTDSALLRYCDVYCHPQESFLKASNPFFATANMAVRKKFLEQLGGFNQSLQSGGDMEFCSRLIKERDEIYYEPKAIVQHLYCNSLIEFMKKQCFYGEWYKFIKKKLAICNSIPSPSYIDVFINYGINFIFFRIVQDISYNIGFCFGRVKNIKKSEGYKL